MLFALPEKNDRILLGIGVLRKVRIVLGNP